MNTTNIQTFQNEHDVTERIRARVSGTAERPRLAVFKSNKFIYAQLIDDVAGKTLCSASDIKVGHKELKPIVQLSLSERKLLKKQPSSQHYKYRV
jgi:ribosomal protein L18